MLPEHSSVSRRWRCYRAGAGRLCGKCVKHVNFHGWLLFLLFFLLFSLKHFFIIITFVCNRAREDCEGLFFSCHVGAGKQTQVLKLGGKHFLPAGSLVKYFNILNIYLSFR